MENFHSLSANEKITLMTETSHRIIDYAYDHQNEIGLDDLLGEVTAYFSAILDLSNLQIEHAIENVKLTPE